MSLLNRVVHSRDDLGVRKDVSDSTSHHHLHHRPLHAHHHHLEQTPPQTPAINLAIELESPPAVLYGHPSESTGSIISGLLLMNNDELINNITPNVDLEYVTLSLVQTIRLNKPFLIGSNTVSSCKDCTNRKNIIARWDVVTGKSTFGPGSHAYPFSHLLPGSLPASSKLGSKHSTSFVKYDLIAVAKNVGIEEEIKVVLPLNITRLILKGPDRNSLRVFPPTEINASALLPNVVYPKSTFPVELKLENVVNDAGDRRWRMRKLSWRVEELTKTRVYCCDKHVSKLKSVENSYKTKSPNSNSKPKPSNVHYSTIQTDTFLSSDSVVDESLPAASSPEANENATGLNGAPVMQVDVSEVERTAPSHAVDNFNEDFGNNPENNPDPSPHLNPVTSGPNGSDSIPSQAGSPTTEQHLYISENRTISHSDIKSGWKSDFSGKGKIELVAEINVMNLSTGLVRPGNKSSSKDHIPNDTQAGLRNGANASCDIEDPNEGIFVSHIIVVEVMVAEETVSVKKAKKSPKVKALVGLEPVMSQSSTVSTDSNSTDQVTSPQVVGTPTGAARVLRMQFKLVMSERSGLGISWDDEVPPTYDDVRTLSPPTYNESSGNNTPQSNPILPVPTNAALRTPGVLYGVAETPGMNMQPSIDGMVELDERIQDFTL